MKRRGRTACCTFKKSEGTAAPPLPGNSVCLGKLPAADPGASLLGGRWPCPGPPAVRWPWAPAIPTVAPLAARKKMPLDLSIALPGAGGEPLGQWPGGHRYVGTGECGVAKGTEGRWHGVRGRFLEPGSAPGEHRHQCGG